MAFVWYLLGKIYFPRHDEGRKELQPRHVNAAPIFSNPLQPTLCTRPSDGWQRFSARSSNSKVNKSISELRSGYNTSCLVNSRLLNHQNGNSNGERKSACRRSGKEGGVFIYMRRRGCYVKGRSSRSVKRRWRRLQPQQRESVFTEACLCETRCLHQRGTLTAACHIQAPEELLLGLRTCECVRACVRVCVFLSPPALLQITLQVCRKGVWVGVASGL